MAHKLSTRDADNPPTDGCHATRPLTASGHEAALNRQREVLERAHWWRALQWPERQAFEDLCSPPRSVPGKSDLDNAGEPGGELFLILDGWFARYVHGPRGLRQTLTILLPGQLTNPEILFVSGPPVGAAALTDGEVVSVAKADLEMLAAQYPSVAKAISVALAERNLLLGEEIARLGRRSARERMAHFICETVTRLGYAPLSIRRSCDFPLTQEQVADVLGLTVVHVNRTLQDLRAMELIEWRAHRLDILDWPSLARLGMFNGAYLEQRG